TRYPAAECPMQLPRTAGQTVARDLDWFCRRDGSRFPVSYVSVPIEMPEGRGAVVLFADIGDRVREEQVLRERDAVLGPRTDSVRRIAALVAGVVGLPLVVVWRYAPDGKTATVIGAWGEGPHPFQPGTLWRLDGVAAGRDAGGAWDATGGGVRGGRERGRTAAFGRYRERDPLRVRWHGHAHGQRREPHSRRQPMAARGDDARADRIEDAPSGSG